MMMMSMALAASICFSLGTYAVLRLPQAAEVQNAPLKRCNERACFDYHPEARRPLQLQSPLPTLGVKCNEFHCSDGTNYYPNPEARTT